MGEVMLFNNYKFHNGFNTTVRKGFKWGALRPGETLAIARTGDIATKSLVHVVRVLLTKFGYLRDTDIADEHDANCTTTHGLYDELCRCYPGFSLQDDITVITFYYDDDGQL